MATDNFNRADGALGVNWTGIAGNVPTVNTNACAGMSGGGDHGAFYSGASFANDQYSEGTLTALTSGASYIGVLVRGSSGNCYGFYASTTDSYLFKVVSNTWTQLGATGPAFANNDVIRIEISSSSITCKKNGSASGMPSATGQTDIASGSPGIFAYEGTASRIDDWTGADLTAGATARTIAFSIARLQRVSRLRRLLRNASEIRTQSSRVSRLRNLIRSLGFAKQANSVVSRLRRLTRTIRTSLTSLSVVKRLQWLIRTISKSATVSPRVQRIASYIRRIAESAIVLLSVSRLKTHVKTILKSASITAQVKRIGYYLRRINLSESIKAIVSRTVSGSGIVIRTIASSIQISSRVSRLGRYIRRAILWWAYGYDSGNYEEGQYDSGSSGKVPSFSVSRIGWYKRTVRVIRSLSSTVSRAIIGSGLYVRSISDSISLSFRVSRLGLYKKTIGFSILTISSVSRVKTYFRVVVAIIRENSTARRIGRYIRTIRVSINTSNRISRIANQIRSIYYYAFPIEVYISDDSTESHAESVRLAFIDGYGSNIRVKTFVGVETYSTSVSKAISLRSRVVIRSFVGVASNISTSDSCYPSILTFWPLGSNSYTELATPSSIPVSVTSGGGSTQNDTGYGNGLEFWDEPSGVSSYSNGRIAGKLLKIKHSRGGSWWDARYAARQTASNSGVWDKFNGYGKIDVAAAIAFSGSVPADPYANGNSELGQIQNISVVGTWISAITTYTRGIATSIAVSTRASGNPILRLIYKIFSSFDTKITSFSSSQTETKDKISSTTKEVD